MKYYRLTDDIHLSDRWELQGLYDGRQELESWLFTTGLEYPKKRSSLQISCSPGFALDFTLADIGVPIVSSQFVDAINLPSSVQLIPVNVRNIGPNRTQYFVLNALKTHECIDEASSIFTKWNIADGRPDKIGQYRMVPKLKIDVNSINQDEIFRISGWTVALIISSTIKNQIVDNEITGVHFEEV